MENFKFLKLLFSFLESQEFFPKIVNRKVLLKFKELGRHIIFLYQIRKLKFSKSAFIYFFFRFFAFILTFFQLSVGFL